MLKSKIILPEEERKSTMRILLDVVSTDSGQEILRKLKLTALALEAAESEIEELREEIEKLREEKDDYFTDMLNYQAQARELEEKVKQVAIDAWHESAFQITSFGAWEDCMGEKHPKSIDVEDWIKQQGL